MTNYPPRVDFEALKESGFGQAHPVQPQPEGPGTLEALRREARIQVDEARRATLEVFEKDLQRHMRVERLP